MRSFQNSLGLRNIERPLDKPAEAMLDIYANQVTAPTRVIINVQCEHHIDVGDE